MQLRTTLIAFVFMVISGPPDGAPDGRGARTEPVDPAKVAGDARGLTARIDAVLADRWAKAKIQPSARRRRRRILAARQP